MTPLIKSLAEQARAKCERASAACRAPGDYYHEAVVSELVEMIRLDERDRITELLYQMHERAGPYHNFYKHAAIEINRKAEVLK